MLTKASRRGFSKYARCNTNFAYICATVFSNSKLKILVVVIYYVINIVVRMFRFAYLSDRKIRDL